MAADVVGLFRKFFTSSIRRESADTRIVFLGMMAMANEEGIVEATPDAVSSFVNIGHHEMMTAMTRLQEPDPDSTSPAEEGRRIIPAGRNRWKIVTFEHYKELLAESLAGMASQDPKAKRSQQLRDAKQRQRDREKLGLKPSPGGNRPVTAVDDSQQVSSRNDDVDDVDDTANPGHSSKKSSSRENQKKIVRTFKPEDVEMRLAQFLFRWIRKNNEMAKEPALQKWAHEFDLMLRIDRRDVDEVKRIIEFAQKDPFWHKNILSPSTMRRQYDRLILDEKGGNKNAADRTGASKPDARFSDYRD